MIRFPCPRSTLTSQQSQEAMSLDPLEGQDPHWLRKEGYPVSHMDCLAGWVASQLQGSCAS